MEYLSLIFRWLHIVPALILVGGVFFLRFCLFDPRSTEPSLLDRQESVRKRWMMMVMVATLLLLVSGFYNAGMKEMGYEVDMVYRGLLTVKILLGLAVFYLAAVLAGRSERAVQMRVREKYWLNILLILMLLIVMIAGYMKIRSAGYEVKVKEVARFSNGVVATPYFGQGWLKGS